LGRKDVAAVDLNALGQRSGRRLDDHVAIVGNLHDG
jgi:hypothetical protein